MENDPFARISAPVSYRAHKVDKQVVSRDDVDDLIPKRLGSDLGSGPGRPFWVVDVFGLAYVDCLG